MNDDVHRSEQVLTNTPLPATSSRAIPYGIAGAVLVVLAVGGLLISRAESRVNKVALAESAKPVTITEAKAATYRPTRMYVGTLEPWVAANVGPQFISAYIDTVLVRPGDVVKKGQVLATLDCRNASATNQAVAMQARAIDAEQKAVSHEASRMSGLLDGGFVSPNELEQKTALQSMGEYVAHRQVLQMAAKLEEGLPKHKVRPLQGRKEVPTRVLDEDTYPVGGFSSLSTRGSPCLRVARPPSV